MRVRRIVSPLVLVLASLSVAQGDGFQREGDAAARLQKDALEGKAPPALQVESWLNSNGVPLKLADLTGKVVVLDFWGVW